MRVIYFTNTHCQQNSLHTFFHKPYFPKIKNEQIILKLLFVFLCYPKMNYSYLKKIYEKNAFNVNTCTNFYIKFFPKSTLAVI